MNPRLRTLGLILGVRLTLGSKAGVTKLFEIQSCFLVQIHAKGYQFDTQTFDIIICIICLHIIKKKIFIIVKKLIMFMLLSEQAMSNPHGSYGRPGSRGHHVGDPWFRFNPFLASVVQPKALLSCVSVMLQATGK